MDSLMPAPRHSTCSGACEGCKAYPKCPEEVYCDDLNCRYSCPDYSIPGWSCARESKISDMILSFTDDKDLPSARTLSSAAQKRSNMKATLL